MNELSMLLAHNTIVITGDKFAAGVLLVVLVSFFRQKEKRKSTNYLGLCCFVELISLLADAMAFSYDLYGNIPVWGAKTVYFIAYLFPGITVIFFTQYVKSYIEEKTIVNKWLFMIPTILMVIMSAMILVAIAQKTVFDVIDGVVTVVGDTPLLAQLIQLVVVFYLPIAAWTKRKFIGTRAVFLLGFFGVVPLLVMFINFDYSMMFVSYALLVVYVLLQNDISAEKERHSDEMEEMNKQLQENQTLLEEAAEEQKAQLEEIKELYTQKEYLSYSCKMVYSEVYLVNLKENTYCELDTGGFSTSECGDYITAIDNHISSGRIDNAKEDEVRSFLAPENIYHGLSENKSIEMRYRRTLRDGNAQWCLTTFVACEMEEGHPTVALMMIQNIDNVIKEEEEQKAILQAKNEEVLEAVERAKAANKSKSDFLSRMSHDIRTPMNVIVGMTEIAKRHFDDSDKVADCLNKINMESVHLQTLINDVLDISAIESGKLTIRKEEVRVKDIIENMNVSMASLVQSKSIDYVFEQGNLFFPYMNTDSLRISQLYLNLLSNAVKYTPAGGRVKFEIWQNLTDSVGKVELHARISDTGMGMSEEFMKTMYSEFSRATDTRVNKIQGTGLGLAIVKQITDLMGGTIEVESELNKGTIFHVILPIEIIEKTDAKKELTDEDFDYEQLKGLKVLIAEDNDFNYEIAEELLSDYGMLLERAEDGAIALDKMDSSEPGYYDLILMDMQMPIMDGLEATREIRKLNREDAKTIPIIAMTANAFAEDALACREAGMDSHVAKPIKLKFLLETILKIRNENKEGLRA